MDYRLNVKDLDNVIDLESTIKLAALEEVEYSLIIGSNLRLEQPMINCNASSLRIINRMLP
jgi:NADH-quinone oxidoreductase subunit G